MVLEALVEELGRLGFQADEAGEPHIADGLRNLARQHRVWMIECDARLNALTLGEASDLDEAAG